MLIKPRLATSRRRRIRRTHASRRERADPLERQIEQSLVEDPEFALGGAASAGPTAERVPERGDGRMDHADLPA